jgi:hypothetical protein
LVYRNENGGLFQPGRMYQLHRKTEVTKVFLWLCKDNYPQCPTINKTAKLSKVSWGFANQVVMELKALGAVMDLDTICRKKKVSLDLDRNSLPSMRCYFVPEDTPPCPPSVQ